MKETTYQILDQDAVATGKRLEIILTKYFKKQKFAAEKLNMKQPLLSDYYNGRSKPGATLLGKLFDAGISLSDIGYILFGERAYSDSKNGGDNNITNSSFKSGGDQRGQVWLFKNKNNRH